MMEDLDRTAANHLQALYDRDGKLTADTVLNDAIDPDSPIHSRFEWDDNVAAHEYRLEQARRIIRAAVIVIDERPTRQFVHVSSSDTYAPMTEVMTRSDWRAEIVERFRRDAAAFDRRWRDCQQIADEYGAWLRERLDVLDTAS